MIISKQQEFSDSQSLLATNQISTNVVDLGATGTVLGAPTALTRDIGPGNPIPIMIQVATAFAGAGTFNVEVLTASTTSMSGATTVAKSGDFTATSLISGFQIPIGVVPNDVNQRYMALRYNLSAVTLTGSVDAAIVAALQTNTAPGRA